MDIIYQILTMYGIAFCISMFVAFVIWISNQLVGNSNVFVNLFRKKAQSDISGNQNNN